MAGALGGKIGQIWGLMKQIQILEYLTNIYIFDDGFDFFGSW